MFEVNRQIDQHLNLCCSWQPKRRTKMKMISLTNTWTTLLMKIWVS